MIGLTLHQVPGGHGFHRPSQHRRRARLHGAKARLREHRGSWRRARQVRASNTQWFGASAIASTRVTPHPLHCLPRAALIQRGSPEVTHGFRRRYFAKYHSTMKALIMAQQEGALPEGAVFEEASLVRDTHVHIVGHRPLRSHHAVYSAGRVLGGSLRLQFISSARAAFHFRA